jgi:cell division cycle 20-like protein 1, cofactor of APC complex
MQKEMESHALAADNGSKEVHTPALLSPPETKTPPTETHKRNQAELAYTAQDRNSEPVDASALSRALEQFERAGRQRERTPTASPSRKRQRIYGDRYATQSRLGGKY